MTPRPLTVAPSASIDRAITLMEEHAIHHLVVTEHDRVAGMLSDRDILVSTGWTLALERTGRTTNGQNDVWFPHRVEQIMSRSVHALSANDDVRDAALLMDGFRVGAVPIVSDERLVGIVTDSDLLRWLDELALDDNAAGRFLEGTVQTLMSSPPICAHPDTPLDDVVAMVRRFCVRHIPVSQNDTLIGIISDRDLRRLVGWSASADAARTGDPSAPVPATAGEIMHENVETIEPGDTLRQALHRMRTLSIHSLPVVRNHRLVGMLTHADFIKTIGRKGIL